MRSSSTASNSDKNSRLTLIGLGAYDNVDLNAAANDGVTDQETFDRNRYILGNLPENNQWNYTVGARYDHFVTKGFHTVVVSRSHLFNEASKYRNNDDTDPAALLLNYSSTEEENKVRYEAVMNYGGMALCGRCGLRTRPIQHRHLYPARDRTGCPW